MYTQREAKGHPSALQRTPKCMQAEQFTPDSESAPMADPTVMSDVEFTQGFQRSSSLGLLCFLGNGL